MAGGFAVEVIGADRVVAAFKVAEGETKLELKGELIRAGKLVEERAHSLIRSQGLVGGERSTGRLDRLTKTTVRSAGTVLVRSGATRQGFSYPRFQEFRRGRPFLYPALRQMRPLVAAHIDRMLARITSNFNH